MTYTAPPSVRSYAGRKGVDLDHVAASSGRKTLAKEDVDHHLSPAAGAMSSASHRYWEVDHSAYGPTRPEPTSRIAQTAAANLSAANTVIPQVTHHDEVDARRVEAFRASLKDEATERGLKLTSLVFHIKAMSQCLKRFPIFNSSLSADGQTLHFKNYIHIGVAVDTPWGLVVPVIRNADCKGLWALARDLEDLAQRAQLRKLRSDDMGGASLSVSNLGAVGGTGFSPIVNPPEVAILGLSRTRTTPVWQDDKWEPVPMTPLDLSYDHRVINGADAARFMRYYCSLIEDPRRMLI